MLQIWINCCLVAEKFWSWLGVIYSSGLDAFVVCFYFVLFVCTWGEEDFRMVFCWFIFGGGLFWFVCVYFVLCCLDGFQGLVVGCSL